MEDKRFYVKDLRAEVSRPLEQIEAERQALIERAKIELEIIAPALKEVLARIKTERPDVVVFLDKGARLFAAPFRKCLQDSLGKAAPRVVRYNDDALKTPYLRNESIDQVVAEDFAPLSGKKVFYIDETFSSGKGAVALAKAAAQSGVNMRYFALTRELTDQQDWGEKAPFEPGKFYNRSLNEYQEDRERILHDPRFTIYPNDIPSLFTRDAAILAVVDLEGKTVSRYESVPANEAEDLYDYTPKRGELPNARHWDNPPTGMDWQQFDEEVRNINMRTVRTLTHMIYEALVAPEKKVT